MKPIIALFLLLMLLCTCACAEAIILDKTRGDHADFAFSDDQPLLEIYFPKIFSCDAALVRYGDMSLLIDSAGNQWKSTQSLLEKLNVTELTYALNTHPDADHIGGFNHLLKQFPAGEFLMGFEEDYELGHDVRFKVYDALHAMNVPMRRVGDGETIEFGDVSITVYQRLEEDLPSLNDRSLTLMIHYGERSIYFSADVLAPAQRLLAQHNGTDINADILKYPHHALWSMEEEFLDAVTPELVIATCGNSSVRGTQYLKKQRIPYLITANHILRLATDGKVWTVERMK